MVCLAQMPRGPRITYPHAVFHVLNRFVDRHPFFVKDRDYRLFTDVYFDTAETFGIWTYAYDLLPNHFHIVLETPTGEISRFLQRFLTRAVQNMNVRHGRVGHLLQGRTKTLLVETDSYFETVMGYVLLNRVRSGLAKDVFSDAYNSVQEMIRTGNSRLARSPLWNYLFGHEFDMRNPHGEIRRCKKWLEELDVAKNEEQFKKGHRGSFLATEEFRKKVLQQTERRLIIRGMEYRRKTDRHLKTWTWAEVKKVAGQIVGDGRWRGIWKNETTAVRHIRWYIASVGAGWTFDQIRDLEGDRGASHSRYSVAIYEIRRAPQKKKLADDAIRQCLQTNKLTE